MQERIDDDKPEVEIDEVLDELKAADLQGCALRVREMAKHALDHHKCRDGHKLLTAVAARLEWFHEHAMKAADFQIPPPVIQ